MAVKTPISAYESSAISILRIVAMLSIVACHILQAINNNWAWVFNVGVQVFLCLSGYLYGHKFIGKWGVWFKNRIIKLFVPLFLYTTIIITFLKYGMHKDIDLINYIRPEFVDGLNHLWFMKAIAICYLITPILQISKRYACFIIVVLILFSVLEFTYLKFHLFQCSWILLYSLGYYIGALGWNKFSKGVMLILFIIFAVLTCFCTWKLILDNEVFNTAWHNILGLFICFAGIFILSKIKIIRLPKLLKYFDRNSFYIYICHHIYLLGPLSVIPLIENKWLAICIVFTLIVITTVPYSYFANFIIQKLKNK